MKNLIIIGLLAVLSGCALFLGSDAPPFKVKAVTSQRWHAGMAGGGKGTNYAFELKMRRTEGVKFDTVWLNDRPFRPKLVEPLEDAKYHRLIMTLREKPEVITNDQGEEKQVWISKPEKPENPPQFDGTAMIIYRDNGQPKTLIVEDAIEKKEPLSYP